MLVTSYGTPNGLHVTSFDNGRTSRASLQGDGGGRSNALTGTDAQIVRPYRSRICASVGFNGDYFNPRLTGGATWDWADVDRFVAQLLFVLYGRAWKLQTDTEYTGA